jgi:hypothetical protein
LGQWLTSAVDFKLDLSSTKNFGFVYNIFKMPLRRHLPLRHAPFDAKLGSGRTECASANFRWAGELVGPEGLEPPTKRL